MKCPHCGTEIQDIHASDMILNDVIRDNRQYSGFRYLHCTNEECEQVIIYLLDFTGGVLKTEQELKPRLECKQGDRLIVKMRMIWPATLKRKIGKAIPDTYAKDFHEAVACLSHSANGSACVSRRLLQRLMHEEASIRKRNLEDELIAFIKANPGLPPGLSQLIDGVRCIGNIGAHPHGEEEDPVDVGPEEAEILVDVIEELFDWLFVGPLRIKAKLTTINEKLGKAGKKPIGSTQEAKPDPSAKEPAATKT